MAADIISLFRDCKGLTRGELEEQLQVLEGEATDYRIKRGLAHLLTNGFSTFETISPVEPAVLREKVFTLSAVVVPRRQANTAIFQAVADELSQELGREVTPQQVEEGLYADLPENQVMTAFEEPTPETLLHRYNLSQVQGVLYRVKEVILTAHRNDPGEYTSSSFGTLSSLAS